MSAAELILSLEKLLQLHKNLYQLTLQKTEILKSENIDELKELLKKEQMFVKAISQLEDERIKQTVAFLGREDELSMSACIEKATGSEQDKLKELEKDFKETIDSLKATNELNRELAKQAIQLVSMTLDMLMPQETEFNYNKPANKPIEKQRRSLFDSQA
ncbi:flagellar protein FlgN [Virgibacillus sp. 6R]|uniref:flagellar protein FlgN n=1 Tax=Metabacillus sp. 22489 TaxID=3453928 RepID=UPI0016435172